MHRDYRPEVFIPLQWEPVVDAPWNDLADPAAMWWLQTGARLNNGVSLPQVNAFLATRSGGFWKAATGRDTFELADHRQLAILLTAEPGATGYSFLRLRFRHTLVVLMGLVSLVLLIACLNLATLMMARAVARAREISTRFTLGASRLRIVRQLLVESLLLAAAGTLLGLALSPALVGLVTAGLGFHAGGSNQDWDVTLDYQVFLFIAGVAVFATVLTGTLPALQATRNVLNAALRVADRRPLWPRVLLSLEVAMALVLLTGASLLGYSLFQANQISTGFEPHGLVYFRLDTHGKPAVYQRVLSEIRNLPHVTSASLTRSMPFGIAYQRVDVSVPHGIRSRVWLNQVGPDYFAAMQTRLLQGREFTWRDQGTQSRQVILSESAARQLFPNEGALGRQISINAGPAACDVIGVVADVRHLRLENTPAPTIYTAALEMPNTAAFTVIARTGGPVAPLISALPRLVTRLLPDTPLPVVSSMDRSMQDQLSAERTMTLLASSFGGAALLMTGIGLYGTLAYATERRTSEIGIRLALGAMPGNVIAMVCAENGTIAVLGCLIGLAGSLVASKTIESFLYGVSPRDPIVFTLSAMLLLCVATVASLVPAVKASRIDAMVAIRYE